MTSLDEILNEIAEAIRNEQYDLAEKWVDRLNDLIRFQRVAQRLRRSEVPA